jgi:hypothetical protein
MEKSICTTEAMGLIIDKSGEFDITDNESWFINLEENLH